MKYDTLEITNGQYVKLRYKTARSGSRVAALIIDRIIQIFLAYVFTLFIDSQFIWRTMYILCVFGYVLIYTFNLWQEVLWNGRTIGKRIMRIRVISEECVPPTFQQCFTRWVLYPIDMWVVGLIMMAEKKQRLGDMASGCYVVFEKEKKDVRVTLEDDYRYGKPGYTPIYTALESMTDDDHNLVLKGLYDPNYSSQQYAIKRHICNKLHLEDQNLFGSKDFLLRLHNDYMYFKSKG